MLSTELKIINQQPTLQSYTHKYLGLIIDEQLMGRTHSNDQTKTTTTDWCHQTHGKAYKTHRKCHIQHGHYAQPPELIKFNAF